MDERTVRVYERQAVAWRDRRGVSGADRARAFADRVAATDVAGPIADLGCGPGWHGNDLARHGRQVLAVDAAGAMLGLVPEHAPHVGRVLADLARLPVRHGALGGAWASRSYVHLARSTLPLALADLHGALAVDAPVELELFATTREHPPELSTHDGDDFPGRRFSHWRADEVAHLLTGAGFSEPSVDLATGATPDGGRIVVRARRGDTLADTVGAGMRLLVCGLNPSRYSATAGVGYARPGNRFWPAALAARLVSRRRDAVHALAHHGIGMTDLAKRATDRADQLEPGELTAGMARLEWLVSWLAPRAVCFVGLAGWREAVDRRARPGIQAELVGGRPVYVMPSTSGLNAHASLTELTDHLRAAAALADRSG